jgi:hypothetical protein
MRNFESGATRDSVEGKPQYEGYLSPLVLREFGLYMLEHQTQADGEVRPADNWQRGIPIDAYMDSMWRHFMDLWLHHRGYGHLATDTLSNALMAILFNVQGYALEILPAASRVSRVVAWEVPWLDPETTD